MGHGRLAHTKAAAVAQRWWSRRSSAPQTRRVCAVPFALFLTRAPSRYFVEPLGYNPTQTSEVDDVRFGTTRPAAPAGRFPAAVHDRRRTAARPRGRLARTRPDEPRAGHRHRGRPPAQGRSGEAP